MPRHFSVGRAPSLVADISAAGRRWPARARIGHGRGWLMTAYCIDVSERIATITLNRPEARNALSSEVLRLLPELMREAEANADVDVMILTGTDPAFCAGLDLKELGSSGGNLGGGSGADGGRNSDGVRGPFPKLTKPLIGADQRGGDHRRVRAGAQLRLPRRQRARQVRRHPLPGRRDAGLGTHRAAAAGDRRPPGPGDELHRQLHARRRGARVRARQPRGAARRADPDHPPARARHHRQRPGRRPPDPLDLRA